MVGECIPLHVLLVWEVSADGEPELEHSVITSIFPLIYIGAGGNCGAGSCAGEYLLLLSDI